MNKQGLFKRSISYYQSYYKLVTGAVIAMMTVLVGSLMVGDAVRGTLVDRVHERLGNTETVITSGTGFLDDEIMKRPLLEKAQGYLLTDGFVSHGGRMIAVQVWGTDLDSIDYGEALINEPLASQLEGEEDFVLHLPAHSLVPSGSLFVTQSYSTQLRLHTRSVKTVEEGGNLLLHNDQTLPLNVFVSREELAEQMELQGKINLIMLPDMVDEDAFAAVWNPSFSGIKVEKGAVTTDRIFMQQQVVDAVEPQRTNLAYLVNDLYAKGDSVPYSFVTATDCWNGEPLTGNEMLVSDYLANRLQVKSGDSLHVDYFVTGAMKALETRTQSFVIKRVIPLEEISCDSLLMANFPGLSNVDRCTDWDSDLPINMNRIQKIDEDYWYNYHQAPKALVAYDAVKKDWGSSFGVATSIYKENAEGQVAKITPQQMGVMVGHPREAGLYSAQNGTDFSSLFLALGFFIILSGILLMQNPLVEMLIQRRGEILLLSTLGYSRKRIASWLMGEIFTVVPFAGLLGTLVGIAYAAVILFLLGTVWSGATHTEGFRLHVNEMTLVGGFIAGMAICALTAWWTIYSVILSRIPQNTNNAVLNDAEILSDPNGFNPNSTSLKKDRSNSIIWGIPLLILCFISFIYNLLSSHSVVLFVVSGLLWLVASSLCFIAYIERMAHKDVAFSRQSMLWKSLVANRSQVLLSFWALAVGVFTVFAVGLNRPDFSHSVEDAATTGSYNLWCDSRIPMEYDLNNVQVRKKLSLQDLDEDVGFMQCLKYTQDEASCLNLNKVSTPTVLGVDLLDLAKDFQIDVTPLEQKSDGIYPILMDQESLVWSMMKSVGDTLLYRNSRGEDVQLLIAGSYPTGIFHGTALMDKRQFRELWPEQSGSRLFLVRTGLERQDVVKDLLETALSEYGLQICTTTERFELFFTVTDTYLTIFLTLGGLGLFIGIISLVVVMRKILVSRRDEIRMLFTLGYSRNTVFQQLYRESVVVPVAGIIIGATGSIISISANVGGAGWGTWMVAILTLGAILLSAIQLLKKMIKQEITNIHFLINNL